MFSIDQCHQRRQKSKSQFGRSEQDRHRLGSACSFCSLRSFSDSSSMVSAIASLYIVDSQLFIFRSIQRTTEFTYQNFSGKHNIKVNIILLADYWNFSHSVVEHSFSVDGFELYLKSDSASSVLDLDRITNHMLLKR